MSNPRKNPPRARNAAVVADEALVTGVQQHLGGLPSLTVGGQTFTPTTLVAFLQSRVDSGRAVLTAKAAHTEAVSKDRQLRAQSAKIVDGLKRIVIGMYIDQPVTLAIFGLAPPKVAVKTAATKAEAAEKAKATREANHPTRPATAPPKP